MNEALIQSEQLSLLKAKVNNSGFWNIVNSVVCQNSIALNINFQSERGFQIIKIYRNCKFQGVWGELKINQSLDNFAQNILDKFLNLREEDVAVKSCDIDFSHFLARLSKFLFCVANWSFLFILYLSSDTHITFKYLQEE